MLRGAAHPGEGGVQEHHGQEHQQQFPPLPLPYIKVQAKGHQDQVYQGIIPEHGNHDPQGGYRLVPSAVVIQDRHHVCLQQPEQEKVCRHHRHGVRRRQRGASCHRLPPEQQEREDDGIDRQDIQAEEGCQTHQDSGGHVSAVIKQQQGIDEACGREHGSVRVHRYGIHLWQQHCRQKGRDLSQSGHAMDELDAPCQEGESGGCRRQAIDLLAGEEWQQMLQRHHHDGGQRLHVVLITGYRRERPTLAVQNVATENHLPAVCLVAYQGKNAYQHPQQ